MSKTGEILNSSGAICAQLRRELGADAEMIFLACSGHGLCRSRLTGMQFISYFVVLGKRTRKLAVHSGNLRHVHIVNEAPNDEKARSRFADEAPRRQDRLPPCGYIRAYLFAQN